MTLGWGVWSKREAELGSKESRKEFSSKAQTRSQPVRVLQKSWLGAGEFQSRTRSGQNGRSECLEHFLELPPEVVGSSVGTGGSFEDTLPAVYL